MTNNRRVSRNYHPKGLAYCRTARSCVYNRHDVCINCGQKKGWKRRKK